VSKTASEDEDLFSYQPPPSTLRPYHGHPPAQAHSETSRAAADSVAHSIGPSHERILALLHDRGERGATDEEMMEALDMGGNTQRPRRRELQLMDMIHDSKTTRPTRSGREAVVWVSGGMDLKLPCE
jgi:hypothetical protein